jgi:hypothetical protein
MRRNKKIAATSFASEAKPSIEQRVEEWIASELTLLAMTN